MKRLFLLVSLISSQVLHAESSAEDSPSIFKLNSCIKNALGKEGENPKIYTCYQAAIDEHEKMLTESWRFANNYLNEYPDSKKELLEEQRLWIKWKDKACIVMTNQNIYGRWGTVRLYGECKVQLLMQRIEYLNNVNDPYNVNKK